LQRLVPPISTSIPLAGERTAPAVRSSYSSLALVTPVSDLTPPTTQPVLTEVAPAPHRAPVLRTSLTPQAEEPAEGVPLRDYLSALRRYAWLVIAAGVIAAGIAVWRMSRELPVYQASAAVRLRDPSMKMSGDLANSGSGATDQLAGYYTDPVLSQIQVLRSRAVAGMVVDSVGLRLRPQNPTFPWRTVARVQVSPEARVGDTLAVAFGPREATAELAGARARAAYGQPLVLPGVTLTFAERPDLPSARFGVASRDAAVEDVIGRVQARQRELTNFIDISYTAYDPNLAQRVANALAFSFQDINAGSAQQASRRRALFIAEQLRSTDSLLMAAQNQLSDFRKSVNAFSPQDKFKSTQEGMAGLQLRRQELAQERAVYDGMARALSAGGRQSGDQMAALAASPQVTANAGLSDIYRQMLRYQTVRDSLTTGPWSRAASNPDVQRLDSLIAGSRTQLQSAVSARSTAIAAQMSVLDGVMSADAASVQQLPDAEAEQQRLGRQVETLQSLADDLLREQQKARIDQAVEAGQVEVVDPAQVPGGPISQGGRRRVLFALLIGLMIGGSGALVLDRLNTALFRREEIEALLHVPVLAIVPRIAPESEERRRLKKVKLPGTALVRRAPNPADALITVTDLHSAGSQAYRKLRTHLIFSTGGDPLRTLLVTSPGAGEGKSTVCANLAVTFAQQHMRVLLVDCDMRRSRLHGLFGVPRTPGLTEVLARQGTLEEAIRPTQVDGLHILPAGTLVPNISELLGGAGMRAVLAELSKRYDLVVVDTPPVLAAADAEILGVQTDAVLLVVRAGHTDRQPAQYAVQQLRAIGARVVGTVLNDPDEKVADYGRYTYYYDYYGDRATA
jgi:capsular exopolysaccharide synthesis family protein